MYRLDYVNIPTHEEMSEDFYYFEDLVDALFEQVDRCCKSGMVDNIAEANSKASMCVKPEAYVRSGAMSLHSKKNHNALVFIAMWEEIGENEAVS